MRDRDTFAIQRAREKAVAALAEESRLAGETDRYYDLCRELVAARLRTQQALSDEG